MQHDFDRRSKIARIQSRCWFLMLTLFMIFSLFAEEVCKFSYRGQPELWNNKTMRVPDDMVAMSEYLYVGQPGDTVYDTTRTPSIMFVLDHSGSMTGASGLDRWGNRFRVTHDLIDTIQAKARIAEIGVAVFNKHLYYDKRDDPIFEDIAPQDIDNAAYIPLLQLNKDYNGKTGYEILKHYLEIDTVNDTTGMSIINGDTTWIIVKSMGLVYKSGWWNESATHINAGINAVRKAMQSAQYKKDNHYTIFISDGEATYPNDGTENDFVGGQKMPTTFTIFFVKQGGQAPQTLVDFTNNVRTNGYSATNPDSEIWEFQNTNYEALMKFLMENVVNQILQKSTHTPTKMIVNNGTPTNNWDKKAFTFPELFPLVGWTTDFEFEIDYHVVRDTLNPNTGLLDTVEYDTTTHTKFTVEIDPNMGELDSLDWDVRCWDRELAFYDNNNPTNVINELMNPLEIRFHYSAGEADYHYTEAEVEIFTVTGKEQDREKFKLTKNGFVFSKEFENQLINDNSTPTKNDGKLQHYEEDTVCAVFRNSEKPKLKLDTLMIKVPCGFAGFVEVDKAAYYDRTADGYVDSILVYATTAIVGGLTETHVQELVDSVITFPDFRNFTVQDKGLCNNGFYILVSEDENHDPFTYVTKDDKLVFREFFFSSGGKIEKKTIAIEDRVAPIIHWQERSALLIDYMDPGISDTLTVEFSEEINNVTAKEPFYFLAKANNQEYQIRLEAVSHNKDKMKFFVTDVNGVKSMVHGDTLWIHETDKVGDNLGNFQNNLKNIRRMLYVDRRIMPYDFIPQAVTPVDLGALNDENIIPNEVIAVIENVEELNLHQNSGGDYYGMMLMVVPDPPEIIKYLDDLRLKGNLTIFDALGNQVVENLNMSWWEAEKKLVTVWNMKNQNLRSVGSGTYVVIMKIEDITSSLGYDNGGPISMKKILVGVKE